MRTVKFIIISLLAGIQIIPVNAQSSRIENTTLYNIEVQGSAATGKHTPFWISSNRYGTVPLEANNGYLRPSIQHNQSLGHNFYWTASLDAILTAPRYKHVYIQQLYAGIGYKNLLLTIGSKENYSSMWDKKLSSGDLIRSSNARPVPEISISIPEFLTVPYTKGWLHFRGLMSVGRSFDNNYLKDYIQTNQLYIQNILWHDKSLFVRLKDTRENFPLYLSFGLQHSAQWGGTSTNPALGKQPQSFKDFIRIFFAKAGGEDSSESAQINVLGSHHISYDFHAGFAKEKWELQAYYQHLSADKSGVLFYNKIDGLWGTQLDLHQFPWIRKIVLEYIITKDQSGPLHYIGFDHNAHPGRGGGADNYYNNDEYTTGYSYFNRGKGTPLIPSPEYNQDGSLGFKNTRIKDFHIGIEGELSSQLSYRTLATIMNGWGTPYKPFLKKQTGVSFLVELNYTHPQLSGWSFTGGIAGDTGDILGNKSYGFTLGISKRGILKNWR